MASKKILLIEDDPMLREALTEKLQDKNYLVHGSDGAEDAYQYLKIEKPHIIMTDLVMQGDGGLEILQKVKSNPMLADVPVIILSNSGTESDIARAHALGVADFIVKSDTPLSELVKRIEKVLTKI